MGKFDAFKTDFVKAGFSPARVADLLSKLNLLSKVQDFTVQRVEQVVNAAAIPEEPVVVPNPFTVTVATGKSFFPGQFVSYYGTDIDTADISTGNRANWIVAEVLSGKVVLAKWVAETDVYKTGTGSDNTGLLYLYLDGGVTLDQYQVIDSEGVPVQPGYFLQIVGSYNGLSTTPAESGMIRGAVNVFSDVA